MHNKAWLIKILWPLLGLCSGCAVRAGDPSLGPAYQEFDLTLSPGRRTEAAGPFYSSEQKGTTHVWAVPPLMSSVEDPVTDYREFDFAYPIMTYHRFGPEYRFQIFQLFSFAGGQLFSGTNAHRFTLFPVYFQQRSAVPEKNYTAVVPIYGHLKNRLFRDEVNFVMMPFYVQSRKRDVVTDNYVYPFVHVRQGENLHGWQFWPFYGEEHKGITYRTNNWKEANLVGGHEKSFAMWPIYAKTQTGIGTTNPASELAVIPCYTQYRSPMRESTSYLWPLGYTHTIDREKKFEEWDAPWPIIEFARGEGKTTDRVWPFFSQSHTPTLEDNWYLWPVYKYNRVNAPPLDRRRTRILLFLYSDVLEKDTEHGKSARRVDFWPFYTARRERNGNRQLQVLSLVEPFMPGSEAIERNYSPVWALWRAQHNPQTGAASQSLLWNLYRQETAPEQKKISLLFGLFKYESNRDGKNWRVLYIPFGKAKQPAKGPGTVL